MSGTQTRGDGIRNRLRPAYSEAFHVKWGSCQCCKAREKHAYKNQYKKEDAENDAESEAGDDGDNNGDKDANYANYGDEINDNNDGFVDGEEHFASSNVGVFWHLQTETMHSAAEIDSFHPVTNDRAYIQLLYGWTLLHMSELYWIAKRRRNTSTLSHLARYIYGYRSGTVYWPTL